MLLLICGITLYLKASLSLRLNLLVNLVTHRSCQKLRVRNEMYQIGPGGGRHLQERIRYVVCEEEGKETHF